MAIKVSGTEVISDDKRILNNEDLPDIRPSLLLDFANSKTLDPRITFTRGSTATYWDGKTTAKAEENLVLYSNNIANAYWVKLDVTVTEGATAPDGSTTAATVQATLNGDPTQAVYHLMDPVPQIGATVSVYAKQGTTEFFSLQASSNNPSALFNLSTGAVLASSGCTATITSVGNGWYRCALENMTVAGNYIVMSPVGSDIGTGDALGNNDAQAGDNVLIWGVQLENRSSATAYTPTTDSPIVKYQPVLQTAASGEARFDHDPVTGESKGLLIEQSRTNLLPYSAASVAGWDNIGLLYLSDSSQNALGVFDGVIVASAGADWHRLRTGQFATTDGQDYAVTTWIQKGSSSGFRIVFRDDDSASECRVDATWGSTTLSENSSVGAGTLSNSSIVYLTDSIAQVNFIVNKDGSSTSTNISIGPDSTTSGDTVIVLGAQFEEGSFPTSYIPTSGSTVTRATDDTVISGSTEFNEIVSKAGSTLYFEGASTSTDGSWGRLIHLGDTTGVGQARLEVFHRPRISSQQVAATVFNKANTNIASITMTGALGDTGDIKVAVAFSENDLSGVVTGYSLVSDTDAYSFPDYAYDGIGIGSQPNGGASMVGHIRKIAIYPKRLPNATLQAMTEE